MIAGAFASANFPFGLFVGHSRIDAFENLPFRQTGIFQARDFRAGHYRLTIQMAVKNELNSRIGQADELECNGINADGIELVGMGDLDDLGLGESSPGQVGRGIGAREKMLADVRGADQLDAGFIADPCVLHLNDLGDFRIRDVEPFELLDITGKHPSLV